MNSCKITIQRKVGERWPVVLEQSAADSALAIRTVGSLSLNVLALVAQVTPRDYGVMLGQALFQEGVRDAFLHARAQSEDNLSVQLLVEAPDLSTLRWERLCAPLDEHWHFLTHDQRAPLSLALSSPSTRRFPLLRRENLRALVLVASPQGLERFRLSPFHVEATVASVRSALGPIPCDVLSTTPDAVGPPTLDALCERLSSTSYSLLHVVCHGRYSSDISDTVIYLANEEQQVDPVTGQRLITRLSQLRGEHGLPQFAFLATCESASPEAEGVLGGLAQSLVRDLGMPVVLAMTETVSISTVQAVTSQFYRRLVAHGQVDLALAEACAGVAERADSLVPALYSRLGARPLFAQIEGMLEHPLQGAALLALRLQEQTAARNRYLEGMCQRYSTVMLPIGPAEGFSLQAIFQPLKLRRDPLAAEDLAYEERRALLGESRSQPDHLQRAGREAEQPVVLADHGEDALHKSHQGRMIILGGPGTGKTTLLMALVGNQARKALMDANTSIPVLLSLPDLARSGKQLQDYLLSLTKDMRVDDRYALVLWQAIEDGHAFLCLDSLDEVAPRQRSEMIRLINELASHPDNTWVVGSRFTEYKGGQFKRGQFAEWELQLMSHDLRQQLAQRLLPELHRLLPGNHAPIEDEPLVFVRTLESHPQAAAWGENPLLFSLAAVIFARTGSLPPSRVALYQQVTDAIFETREQDATRRKMFRRVVADLALDLYRTKGRTFTREDIVILLPTIRQRQLENWSTEEMTNGIVTSGILDVVAQETYGFRHQTFQEYLAAVALAQRLVSQDTALREKGWAFAWSKRTYRRWTGILRLMVGVLVQEYRREGAKQAQHWLLALVGQRAAPEGDIANLGLALALESLAEVSETKTGNWRAEEGEKVEAEIVMSWVAVFSDMGDHHDRWLSLNQQQRDHLQFLTDKVIHCSEHAAQIAVEQLTTKLRAENWQVRQAAVVALLRVRERVSVEAVLAFLHDKNSEVRRAIVELLGNLGERVPVDALLCALGDEDFRVRSKAEAMLLQNQERIPTTRLIPLLHSEDWQTRTSAAKVLAQLGVRVPVDPFLADLNERDWQRRESAVWVLAKLGSDAPIESLFVALGDKEINVQMAAAEALGELHAHVPLERLVDALHDSNREVRQAAVKVLSYLHPVMPSGSTRIPVHPGDTSVNAEGMHISRESDMQTLVDLVLRMLGDNDQFVRSEAAQALVGLGEHVLVPVEPLVAALDDEYEHVRSAAAAALGNIRVGVPVEPLLKVLDDESKYVRQAAAKALGKIGVCPPKEFLLGGIGRQLIWMQVTAAQVLCNMPEHVPIQVFVGMLTHENAHLRAIGATALGQCGDQAPIEPLLVALQQDEDVRVRVAAAESLGKFGERTPLEPLVSMLNAEALQVREEVARTLGALGERVPLERFLEALGDEHASVRAAAANVLGELGTRTPVAPLLRALHDPDPSVRRWAVWALGKVGKRASIEPLLAALQDEDDEVRSAAIEALEQLAEDVPLESLLVLLRKGDEKIGIAVWQVLENLGKPLPVEMVAVALSNPEEQVRLAAIRVIGHMREATLVERLWSSLNDIDEYAWDMEIITTAEALSQLVEHVPIESLRQAVKSKQWQVRRAAVYILGQLKEQAPVDALLTAIDDDDWSVSESAVRALAGLGVYAPVERLFTLLREGGQDQRGPAAEALGEIGGRIPLEPLLAAVDEEVDFIREDVITALGKLEGPGPIEPLVAALGDSEKRVRDAAIEALHRTHPEALLAVVPEAIAIVQRGESGNVLGSMQQGVTAEAIGNLGYDSPILLEKLTQLLDWPYWEVRMKAAQALGKIRRNIPDAAIRRLLELRHDPQSRAVRLAASDALAEILSLETGIEED